MKAILVAAISLITTTAMAQTGNFYFTNYNDYAQSPLMPNCSLPTPMTGYAPGRCYTTEAPYHTHYSCTWISDTAAPPIDHMIRDNFAYYRYCSSAYAQNIGPIMLMFLDPNDPTQQDACIAEPSPKGQYLRITVPITSKDQPYQVIHCGGLYQSGHWEGGETCPTNSVCRMQRITTPSGQPVTKYRCVEYVPPMPPGHNSAPKVSHQQFPSMSIQTTAPTLPFSLCKNLSKNR